MAHTQLHTHTIIIIIIITHSQTVQLKKQEGLLSAAKQREAAAEEAARQQQQAQASAAPSVSAADVEEQLGTEGTVIAKFRAGKADVVRWRAGGGAQRGARMMLCMGQLSHAVRWVAAGEADVVCKWDNLHRDITQGPEVVKILKGEDALKRAVCNEE
eukprot:1157460-Pelagomonas_calceolata.AAC.12